MSNYEKYGFCPFSKNLTSDDCDTICFCEDCNTFFDGYNKAIDDYCNRLCDNGSIADFMKDYFRDVAKELKRR